MKKFIALLALVSQSCFSHAINDNPIDEYNQFNNQKIQSVTNYAKNINLSEVPEHFRFFACGPVTLLPSLQAVHKIPKEETLLKFVNTLHGYGDFSNFGNGMTSQQLQDSLDSLSIKSLKHRYYDMDYAIDNIINDLNQNSLVYLIVKANVSYSVLTHTSVVDNWGYHWVQIVSTNKDKSGKVSKVAVYDINAFLRNKKSISYIDISQLKMIMQPSFYEGFGSNFGIYVSTEPLNS